MSELPLVAPVVTLSGTSRDELLGQYETILEALRELDDALAAAAPHGRDYHVKGNLLHAQLQHRSWRQKVQDLKREVEAVALQVMEQ